MRQDFGVDDVQEVLGRHILLLGFLLAVAATVTAVGVATQRAFPEEGLQRVQLGVVVPIHSMKLESYALPQVHECPIFS